MKTQRVVSLSLGLVFVIMFLSSGVLYFIPDRRVTDWSGWSFLGLDKQQWDNLHIVLGLFFLVFLVWHIYYNWKPIKNYLKEKKKLILFTKEFNLSLALVALFTVGTIGMYFPFSFLVNVGNGIKAINAHSEGTPPFGYAEEATLLDYAILTHVSPKKMSQRLKAKGIVFHREQTLKEVASLNHMSPQALSLIIEEVPHKRSLPSDLPVGIAHKKLQELANVYDIDLERFLAHLKRYHIHTTPQTTFKKIAKEHHLHPATLYNMLLASQVKEAH